MTDPARLADELPPEKPPSRWRRPIVLTIEVAVILGLAWALYRRREGLIAVLDLDVRDVLLIFAITAAAAPLRALELMTVTTALGARMEFAPSLALTQAANLLNYLPMQAGLILRARVLKSQRGLSYTRYIALMTTLIALAIGASATVGLLALGPSDLPPHVRGVAGSVFVVLLVTIAVLFSLPLHRIPFGASRLGKRLKELVEGWRQIKARPRALFVLLVPALSTPILLGLRYWICFGAFSRSTGVAESILFAASVLIAAPVNVTPAGLGVRELIGSAIGAAAGLGFTEVLAAVTIDRGVSILYSASVGGISLGWLRRNTMI